MNELREVFFASTGVGDPNRKSFAESSPESEINYPRKTEKYFLASTQVGDPLG